MRTQINTLCPSILRLPRLRENESRLYHELLIECPEEFEKCPSHLEKLVKMQHYGLPTRLLDITGNLLVGSVFLPVRPDRQGMGNWF